MSALYQIFYAYYDILPARLRNILIAALCAFFITLLFDSMAVFQGSYVLDKVNGLLLRLSLLVLLLTMADFIRSTLFKE